MVDKSPLIAVVLRHSPQIGSIDTDYYYNFPNHHRHRWRTRVPGVEAFAAERAEQASDCFRDDRSGPQIFPCRALHQRKCCNCNTRAYSRHSMHAPFSCWGGQQESHFVFLQSPQQTRFLSHSWSAYIVAQNNSTQFNSIAQWFPSVVLLCVCRTPTSCSPPSSRTTHCWHGSHTRPTRPPRSWPPSTCTATTTTECPRTASCTISIATKWSSEGAKGLSIICNSTSSACIIKIERSGKRIRPFPLS